MRKTKVTKKILASILSASLIIGTLTGVGISSTETVKAKDYGISNPRINADGSVTWDKVKFGSYKQSVEIGEAEPIKWRILSVDENNNALLLADKGLDCKPYNEEYESVTWETCTLRTWLNDDFYKEAFTEAEQAEIKQVMVKNDDNPKYGTEGGNNTSDKVYLLSIEEASNSAYGFDSTFNTENAARECKVTNYARMNGAWRSSSSGYAGNGYWWLRSPGLSGDSAAYVDFDGWGYDYGDYVGNVDKAIRPCLQINLSSSLVTDAGEVASDGAVTDLEDGYNNPKVTDDGTVWDCVYFGRYKQSNISGKEPIEWRVLSVDGDEALLLADKGLDCKPYNEEYESVTWETSTLRSWLNENFYNEAFTETEQAAVKQIIVKNDDNASYGTEGGNDTSDKVYLLSIEEASNSAYGFNSTFNTESAARECKVTDYAYMNGAWRSSSSGYAGNGSWWLRSPGDDSDYAVNVYNDGWGNLNGNNVDLDYEAIRSALRINLSSSAWETAGTVSTGAGDVNPNQPTQTPKPSMTPEASKAPNSTDVPQATSTPVVTETPKPTTEPSKAPASTDVPQATTTPDVTKTPEPTAKPSLTPEPTKTPEVTPTPSPSPSQTPVITATPTPVPVIDNTQSADDKPQLKTIKLSSVVCKRNTTKITGKVSVTGATVKIKVGSKAYKKAVVKGKKFALKVAKLKKKTKVVIKVTKSGYKSLSKTYKVK